MTDPISSSLSKIKSMLMGKTEDGKAKEVDDIIDDLSDTLLKKSKVNYADLIRTHLTQSLVDKSENVVNQLDPTAFTDPDNITRLRRYVDAEEICDNITYVASAIQVLCDEIISPDEITKESIQILNPKSGSTEEDNSTDIDEVRKINKTLEIDDLLHPLVHNTLKYGDQFVEICSSISKEVPLTQSLLTEIYKNDPTSKGDENIEITIHEAKELTPNMPFIVEKRQKTFSIELLTDDKIGEESTDPNRSERKKRKHDRLEKEPTNIKNTRLILHDPAYVIKLQTSRFKLCLGYLILPKYDVGTGGVGSSGSCSSGGKLTNANPLLFSSSAARTQLDGVDKLYAQLMQLVRQHIHKEKDEIKVNKKEVMALLDRVVREVDEYAESKVQIRYVPPERMQHFVADKVRFFPYGESVLFKLFFSAKLLILQETAVAMKRMTDSVDKRVFYMETGLPRQTRNLIDQLKMVLKKRKISLDTIGSIGAIPSMVTSYEDIIIPMSKGKRYVEHDSIAPTMNARDATEELKYFRDQLVAGLRVPPSFIGLEENVRVKANLSQESIIFARVVVSYQKIFSNLLKELFKKIYTFSMDEIMPDVTITLPPPKLLQAEIQAEHVNTAVQIIDQLTQLGLPKEYLKRKYLNIDWNEVDKFQAEEKLDREISKALTPEEDIPPEDGGMPPSNL